MEYYTPEIEEFYVGFEYEIRPYNPESDYRKYIFPLHPRAGIEYPKLLTEFGIIESYLKRNQIRVKYLDKEDIESLGWKTIGMKGYYTINSKFPEGYSGTPEPVYTLIDYKGRIEIRCSHPAICFGNFLGDCKNKSELKKIMKQLGIK